MPTASTATLRSSNANSKTVISNFKSVPSTKSIQPLYLAQANAFVFDSCWTPLRHHEVPISILYDENRAIYRIISMDLGASNGGSKKVLINSTILPCLEFHKTSATFGHWTDKSTTKIHGIGFQSQFELDAFEDSLKKAQSAIYTLVRNPNNNNNNPKDLTPKKEEFPKKCIYPSGARYKNWNQLLHHAKKTHAKVPPISIPEPASPIPLLPPPQGQGQMSQMMMSQSRMTTSHREQLMTAGGRGFNPTSCPPCPPNPLPPPPPNSNMEELHSLRQDNDKLRQVTIESCTNSKKWEILVATTESENKILLTKLAEGSAELEQLKRDELDFRSAMGKWQERLGKKQVAIGGSSSSLELEQKIRFQMEENSRLESMLGNKNNHNLEKLSLTTLEEFNRLEAFYKTVVENAKNKLDKVSELNEEGMRVFRKMDYLFAKCINDMITIHGKIKGLCNHHNDNHSNSQSYHHLHHQVSSSRGGGGGGGDGHLNNLLLNK